MIKQVVFFCLLICVCKGSSVYVNPTFGEDVQGCGNDYANACKTISFSVNQALENDEIILENGNYVQETLIQINKNLTINAENNYEANITCSNTNIQTSSMFEIQAHVIMNGILLQSCTNTSIYISSTGKLELYFSQLNYNEGESGGAIYSEGELIIDNSSFMLNSAVNNGGAIFVASNSKLNLSNSELTDNSAENGGVVYISPGTIGVALDFNNINFNIATKNGGGIYSSDELLLVGNNFVNNFAENGGAIYLSFDTPTNEFLMDNNDFSYNNASNGGALYLSSTSKQSLLIQNTICINNFANMNGGCFYAENFELNFENISCSQNQVNSFNSKGACIYFDNSQNSIDSFSLSIKSATISSNILSNEITTNEVDNKEKAGGVIYINGNNNTNFTLQNGSILSNEIVTTYYQFPSLLFIQGVNNVSIDNLDIKSNVINTTLSSFGCGFLTYIQAENIEITNTDIEYNTLYLYIAENDGDIEYIWYSGAVYLKAPTVFFDTLISFTTINLSFIFNFPVSQFGGLVVINSTSEEQINTQNINLDGTYITQNTLYVDSPFNVESLNFYGSIFSVYSNGNAIIQLLDTSFVFNSINFLTTFNLDRSFYGGHIYINNPLANVILINCDVTYNQIISTNYANLTDIHADDLIGGLISIHSNSLIINYGDFANNWIILSDLFPNSCNGGILYFKGNICTISGVNFLSNLVILSTTFSSEELIENGGIISIDAEEVIFDSLTFSQNSMDVTCTTSCPINGQIYVNSPNFQFKRSIIQDNVGYSTYLQGGVVSFIGKNITIEYCDFSRNFAYPNFDYLPSSTDLTFGGALYLFQNTYLNISHTIFISNIAVLGGAIAFENISVSENTFNNNENNLLFLMDSSSSSITSQNVTYDNNYALLSGGAIYVLDTNTLLSCSDFGSSFQNNTSENTEDNCSSNPSTLGVVNGFSTTTWPGEILNLTLCIVDYFNTPVNVPDLVLLVNTNNETAYHTVIDVIRSEGGCFPIYDSYFSGPTEVQRNVSFVTYSMTDPAFNSSLILNFYIANCFFGYVFDKGTQTCSLCPDNEYSLFYYNDASITNFTCSYCPTLLPCIDIDVLPSPQLNSKLDDDYLSMIGIMNDQEMKQKIIHNNNIIVNEEREVILTIGPGVWPSPSFVNPTFLVACPYVDACIPLNCVSQLEGEYFWNLNCTINEVFNQENGSPYCEIGYTDRLCSRCVCEVNDGDNNQKDCYFRAHDSFACVECEPDSFYFITILFGTLFWLSLHFLTFITSNLLAFVLLMICEILASIVLFYFDILNWNVSIIAVWSFLVVIVSSKYYNYRKIYETQEVDSSNDDVSIDINKSFYQEIEDINPKLKKQKKTRVTTPITGIIKSFTDFIQLCQLLVTLSLTQSDNFAKFGVLSFTYFNCFFPSFTYQSEVKFFVIMFAPLALLSITISFIYLFYLLKGLYKSFNKKLKKKNLEEEQIAIVNLREEQLSVREIQIYLLRLMIFFLTSCYIHITQRILMILQPCSEGYMTYFPWIECTTTSLSFLLLLILSGFFFVLYSIGIPVLFTILLFFRNSPKKVLKNSLQIFTQEYREKYFYFDILWMIRKFLIIFSVVFISNELWGFILALCTLIVSIVLQVFMNPYMHKLLHMTQLTSSLALVLLYCCSFLVQTIPQYSENVYFFYFMITLLLVVFSLYLFIIIRYLVKLFRNK